MSDLSRTDILNWLRQTDPRRLGELYVRADSVRRSTVGDQVHLRGLIEISNHCVRRCTYCGLRGPNVSLPRYRMSAPEIMDCVAKAVTFGYGTVVIQAGEDPGIETAWMADLVHRIKSETPLAVTLSLGERPDSDLAVWRSAGADRYLLRFETSDPALYDAIHPSLPGIRSDRVAILRRLAQLGYEVGSGVMVGIPGQTFESLARDIELFATLDLDMIGVGPYLPHPATPLGKSFLDAPPPAADQVPNSEDMTCKVIALTRILCPQANIPSTTALATLDAEHGRELGLLRGANVVMPNLTPPQYRVQYEIYPGKACIHETAQACNTCLRGRIRAIGRKIGAGPGSSPRFARLAVKGVPS